MSVGRFLQQAAAGNAGEAVYVDDVFSTYLYEGTGAEQTIRNGIKLGNNLAGPSARFNNTSDYLNGTLSGGSNTKTLTFSGWFYKPTNDTNSPFAIHNNSGNLRFYFQLDGGAADTFQIRGYNTSGTQIFRVTSNTTALSANRWYHILLSIDLSNSSNRYLYLDDVAVSANWATYTNDNIDLSQQDTFVGTFNSSQTGDVQTYISNLYLDYTYRNLSVESNRRLFITSDETPATGQASLNPVLYLPLDSASLGSNSGTGGDLSTVGSPYYDEDFGPYIGADGEGGLVWIKGRTQNIATQDHRLIDTARGVNQAVSSSTNDNVINITGEFTSFNSNGFTLAATSGNGLNRSGEDYCSWTFRNQPGFFQVLTYEGNGTAGRTVSHSLGSVPGCIMVKAAESGVGFNGDWLVYHRGNTAAPETDRLILNSTAATADSNIYWNDTAPTATEFTLGASNDVNGSGVTYVAYLFAHDAQDFGTNSDEAIIKCGSYTGNGSTVEVDLGFEPQWVLTKKSSSAGAVPDWHIYDSMRGIVTGGIDSYLRPNLSDAEISAVDNMDLTATGFKANSNISISGETYIYVAIRRPHKPASEFAATELFTTVTGRNDGLSPTYETGFVTDMGIQRRFDATQHNNIYSRITGIEYLSTSNTDAQKASGLIEWDYMNGAVDYFSSVEYRTWFFRRAPGFFDVVAYTGTGANLTLDHNLGVTPEFMIVKGRTINAGWHCYHKDVGNTSAVPLNENFAASTSSFYWNNTSPTDTQATLGAFSHYNVNNQTGILYLFATVPGISKVGSYSGTGSDVDVDCGFTSGARFVLVKRTDSTGDWYFWDSERGIVAGNDPYLLLNSTAAQVTSTDYIDPLSSGFTITLSAPAALNTSGGTYIFLAIA